MYKECEIPGNIRQPAACEYHDTDTQHLRGSQIALNLIAFRTFKIFRYQSGRHALYDTDTDT